MKPGGEQLGLFAPRRPAAPAGCARVPGPLCRDGREGRCPGGPRCAELGDQESARIRAAEAEVAAGRSALPPPLVVDGVEVDLETTLVGGVARGVPGRGLDALPGDDGSGGEEEGAAVELPDGGRGGADGVGCGEGDGGGAPGVAEGGLTCARGTDHNLADCDPACSACGSTTGAVFYERGPLAGTRRCWTCAKPALDGA